MRLPLLRLLRLLLLLQCCCLIVSSSVSLLAVGDSITQGCEATGCESSMGGWRVPLCLALQGKFGAQTVSFVGSQSQGKIDGCQKHEGVAGDEIQDITDRLSGFSSQQADAILLSVGSNDLGKGDRSPQQQTLTSNAQGKQAAQLTGAHGDPSGRCWDTAGWAAEVVVERVKKLVVAFKESMPAARIFLATIPLMPTKDHAYAAYADCSSNERPSTRQMSIEFNNQLKEVQGVTLVDVAGGSDVCPEDDETVCADYLHPTSIGYEKMMRVWLEALTPYMESKLNPGSSTQFIANATN